MTKELKSCEEYLQDDKYILESKKKITQREYEPSHDANNYYVITCPFCGAKTRAQVRGYHSRGRRCSKCRAMFRGDIATKGASND